MATGGTTRSISPVSSTDVQKRKATPPMTAAALRSAMETLMLTVFCRTWVSELRRLISSPVRLSSKNAISWSTITRYTRLRRSATMRSPATVKRIERSATATACTAKMTRSTSAA